VSKNNTFYIKLLKHFKSGGGRGESKLKKPLQEWMSILWPNTTEESTSRFHHIFGQYDTHANL